MDSDLLIMPFRHGPFWNFSYVIGSLSAGRAVVIDPAWGVGAMLTATAQTGLRITGAIVTHAHDDHAHGLAELAGGTEVEVIAHQLEVGELRAVYDGPISAVEHGDEWRLGDHRLRLLHTPGHTAGSLSVLVDGALFTGDTLMVGSLGRAGPAPEDAIALWRTMTDVLGPLPGDTIIYPGHDYGRRPRSTLGDERASTPGLRASSYAEFLWALGRSE